MLPIDPAKISVSANPIASTIAASHSTDWSASAKSFLYENNNGKPFIETSVRHFNHVQNSTTLRGTPLEGGQHQDALRYWKDMLELWKSNTNLPFPHGLSEKEIQKIQVALKDIEDFTYKSTQEVLELMKQKLSTKKQCYFPSGWVGHPGHFMILKFELKGSVIHVSPMTKGGGAEYHPIAFGGHKNKRAYKTSPIAMPANILDTKVGLSLVTRLMRLKSPELLNVKFPLEGADLYGLLNVVGNSIEQQMKLPGVTTQRSGNCSDTGFRMTLYEAIFEGEETRSPTDHKRAMHAFKFQSLTDGFKQFKTELDKGNRNVYNDLSHALHEHFTRLSKLYPEIINLEELSFGLAVGEEIRSQLKAFENRFPLQAKAVSLPSSVISATVINQDIEPVKLPPPLAEESIEAPIDIKLFNKSPQRVNPSQFVKETTAFLATVTKSKHKDQVFNRIYEYVQALPMASDTEYWNSLSSSDRLAVLESFSYLCQLAYKKIPSANACMHTFVLASKLYDIASYIAPKISELRIPGNADFVWNHGHESLSYYSDPEALETLQQIRENFSKRRYKGIFTPFALFQSYMVTHGQFYNRYSYSDHRQYIKEFVTSKIRQDLKQPDQSWVPAWYRRSNEEPEVTFARDETRIFFPSSYHQLQLIVHAAFPFSYEKHSERILEKNPAGNNTFIVEMPGHDRRGKWKPDKLEAEKNKLGNGGLASLISDCLEVQNEVTENSIFVKNVFSSLRIAVPPNQTRLFEELALLAISPDLLVYATLDWASKNLHMLRHDDVKYAMEQYLLRYDLLAKALKDQDREIIPKIQDFLNRGIQLYIKNPQDIPHLLWLSKIGTILECYVKKYSPNPDTAILPDFYQLLKDQLPNCESKMISHVYDHMVYTFASINPAALTDTDVANLYAAKIQQIIMNGKFDLQSDIGSKSNHTFLQRLTAMRDIVFLSEPEKRNRILTQILSEVLDQKNLNLNWKEITKIEEDDWVIVHNRGCNFSDGEYRIDLDQLKIYRNGHLIRRLDEQIRQSEAYKTIFGNESFLYTLKDNYFYKEPLNDSRIIVSNDDVRIQKQFSIDNQMLWMEYTPSFNEPTLPLGLQKDHYQFWKTCDNPPSLYIRDTDTKTFCYRYQSATGWVVLDSKGSPTPTYVANLLDNSDHSWKNYLSQIEPLSNVLLRQAKNENGEWEVQSLDFTRWV